MPNGNRLSSSLSSQPLSQALVSKHLQAAHHCRMVQRRSEGSLVYYDMNEKAEFRFIAQAEKQLLAVRRQRLDALAAGF